MNHDDTDCKNQNMDTTSLLETSVSNTYLKKSLTPMTIPIQSQHPIAITMTSKICRGEQNHANCEQDRKQNCIQRLRGEKKWVMTQANPRDSGRNTRTHSTKIDAFEKN